MRNFKKFLALVLAMLMVVSAAATVSAFSDVAEDNQYNAAINDLVEKGIVNGVGDDKFDPDASVERYQMALMMARALDPDKTNEEWATGMSIFTDVTEWYGAINYAYMNGIVTGIGNLQFAPHEGIKYQDALIMALRALGYTVDVSGDPYWLAAYNQAAKIGLTKNVAVNKGDHVLTRAETAQVIFNMLYTTPADGGATIAAKNFGEATVKNTTIYVITATSNQSFVGEAGKVADDKYVTIQALNTDGTLGDGMYVEFSKLGFGEDVKPDDVIGYSVKLVNLKDDGNFDKAIAGTATTLLTSDEKVSYDNDTNKLTIDGRVYYLTDSYEKNTIKNEIIVKTDDGKIPTEILDNVSKLLYDPNGNVVDKDGKVLAYKQSVTAANGQTLYKLASADDKAFLLYTASELLNVSEIANKYNSFSTEDGYVDLKKVGDNDALQFTLFDDNGDGKYDRAISTPVYMSVYAANNWKDECQVDGPAKGVKVNVVGADLAKGDVFVYTYNKQTKTINVITKVEVQYGTIERINLTGDVDKYTVTINDTAYKFGGKNSAKNIGATLVQTNADKLIEDGTIGKIVSEPALDFVNTNRFANRAYRGAAVKYYAYNGYIIYAESYDVEESFSLVAIKNMIDISSKGLIADIYVDGKLVEDAIISEVQNESGKTVSFADLSSLYLSSIAAKYFRTETNIYKGIKLDDNTYRLGACLYTKSDGAYEIGTITKPDVTESVKNKGFGLFKATIWDSTTDERYGISIDHTTGNAVVTNKVEFLDGISANGDKYTRLRTNENTVFYFISADGKLQVVTTSAKDSVIYINTNTEIYADKVGYADYTVKENGKDVTKTSAGIASRVIVYNYKALDGFGIASTVHGVAFIPKGYATKSVEIADAQAFGLGSSYEGTYYKYNDAAVNMSNGDKTTLYSADELEAGKAYEIDENGVVILDRRGNAIEVELASKDVVRNNIILDDAYFYITNGVVKYSDKVHTFRAQLIDKKGVDVQTDGKAKELINEDNGATIYFLKDKNENGHAADLKDGIFVAIIENKATSDKPTPVTPAKNATWGWGSDAATINTNLPAVIGTDDKGNTTITLYDDKDGDSTDKEAKNLESSIVKCDENGYYTIKMGVQVSASFDKTVLTVTDEYTDSHGLPFDLEAGAYEVTFTFNNAKTGSIVKVVYSITVK